ncbi:MAG: D-aminoacylase, partial [Gemmatimonadota bacterium]|nr:D-aminoacylase [Gemmatimonadota bacterium]
MTLTFFPRRAALCGVLLAALPPRATLMAQGAVDVLITGAMVYDGTGAPGRVTNVGLRGDRIAFVGDIPA